MLLEAKVKEMPKSRFFFFFAASEYYRKRGSASYIVREVLSVREIDTERERERER